MRPTLACCDASFVTSLSNFATLSCHCIFSAGLCVADDPDFHIWRPNMDAKLVGPHNTFDHALAASVTWAFCDPNDDTHNAQSCKCAGGKAGVRVTHSLTVWGQPEDGPPMTADEVGAKLPGIPYCCTVGPEDGTTRGRCRDHECDLDPNGARCESDDDCNTCNMVLTRDDENANDPTRSPYPKFDPECNFILGAKTVCNCVLSCCPYTLPLPTLAKTIFGCVRSTWRHGRGAVAAMAAHSSP